MAEKEPFVPPEDRPNVELPKPDQPLTELRVRDLSALLGNALTLKPWFKEWKDHKHEKLEKPEFKEWKDHKHEKFEKPEHKEWKDHKPEQKEFKLEKIEVDGVIGKQAGLEPGPDPTQRWQEVINQVIQSVSELKASLDKLGERVAALEKGRNK
ncbi:MAG: hypothetical protein K6T57_08645 [Thermaceae bacterium]|nr:hypothetical protein [Thermaceae bacterium]